MSYYNIVNLLISSEAMPLCYEGFRRREEVPEGSRALKISYAKAEELTGDFEELVQVSGLRIGTSESGWVFEDIATGCRMRVNQDYSFAWLCEGVMSHPELWGFMIQLFIEGRLLDEGVLTLHSSCVLHEGRAYAFSGPSGCGKSTRARMWVLGFGAQVISGDRPAVHVREKRFYGVPWDGKEQVFNNINAPCGAVMQVRRSPFTRIRKLTPSQARNFLISQIYIPMWDSEKAAEAMMLLNILSGTFPVYRLFCGRDEKAAFETEEILLRGQEKIEKECADMRLNEGFVLKSMAGEYVLMPTGSNIAKFNGTVLLNEVSAFVIRQLEAGPLGREDIVDLLLSEYDADRETVKNDLDELLGQLEGMGVISRE